MKELKPAAMVRQSEDLAALAAHIKAELQAENEAIEERVRRARNAGEWLKKAWEKTAPAHQWYAFLEAQGISHDTARNRILIFDWYGRLSRSVRYKGLSECLKWIAEQQRAEQEDSQDAMSSDPTDSALSDRHDATAAETEEGPTPTPDEEGSGEDDSDTNDNNSETITVTPPTEMDPFGLPVPEPKKPVFAELAKFKEAEKLCRELAKVIDAIGRGPAGHFYRRDLSAMGKSDESVKYRDKKLGEVLNTLKHAAPYASVCPYCVAVPSRDGKKCDCCEGHGWVIKDAFRSLPPEYLEKIEALKPAEGGAA